MSAQSFVEAADGTSLLFRLRRAQRLNHGLFVFACAQR